MARARKAGEGEKSGFLFPILEKSSVGLVLRPFYCQKYKSRYVRGEAREICHSIGF